MRSPVIPEGAEFPLELRHLIYDSHRIIFHADDTTEAVIVVRVYHSARRRLRPGDVDL